MLKTSGQSGTGSADCRITMSIHICSTYPSSQISFKISHNGNLAHIKLLFKNIPDKIQLHGQLPQKIISLKTKENKFAVDTIRKLNQKASVQPCE